MFYKDEHKFHHNIIIFCLFFVQSRVKSYHKQYNNEWRVDQIWTIRTTTQI